MASENNIKELLEIMEVLRTPETGCPWDLEQDFATIAPYTIEEAYEVADAIERQNMDDLKDELGDLLLQVVFHSQIASERNLFTFHDVVKAISEKMIRRHPHIFSTKDLKTSEDVKTSWEQTKEIERKNKGLNESALDGIALSLPSLLRAEKLTKRAARVNFDWPDSKGIFDKIKEEIAELEYEINEGTSLDRIEDEIGDLLFCLANLARHFNLAPETTLKNANNKFEKRFRAMEESFRAQDVELKDQSLEVMEQRWQEIKKKLSESN